MAEAEASEESVWILKQSEDETGTLVCEPCKEDEIHVDADGFCSECNEYLCFDCRKAHRRNKASNDHAIVDKDDMPRIKPKQTRKVSEVVDDTCTEKCDYHPQELIKYFCNNHGCLGCSVCITVDHRACDGVSYIPDLTADLLHSQLYKRIEKELQKVKGRSEIVAMNATSNISHAEQHCDEVIDCVQGLSERALEAFTKLDKTITLEINQLKLKDIETLNRVSEEVSKILEEIEELSLVIDKLRTTGQLCQLFIVMKKAEEKMRTWNNNLDNVDNQNNISRYEFRVNPAINDMINGVKRIGKLTQSDPSAKTVHHNVAVVRNPNGHNIQTLYKSNPFHVRHLNATEEVELEGYAEQQIQVKRCGNYYTSQRLQGLVEKTLTSVRSSQITGSALLPDDKLVIADAEQQKLKLVNLPSTSVICELALSSKPYDVTVVGQQEVAAAMPMLQKIIFVTIITNRTVLFVKANDSLKIDREIQVSGQCRGLAFKNNQLFVSFTNPAKVEILSMNGAIQRSIKEVRSPDTRMIWPHYVALSVDGMTIYVSDYDDNSIKALNLDGTIKGECRDVTCPTGIAVDIRGNVLLVESFDSFGRIKRNESLIILNKDCKKVDVIEAGFSCPRSLSYCMRTGRLFVGQYSHASFGNCGLSVYLIDQVQRYLSA